MTNESSIVEALKKQGQGLRDGAFIGLSAMLSHIAEGGHLDGLDMRDAALDGIRGAADDTDDGMRREGLRIAKGIFRDALADWTMGKPRADDGTTPRWVREGIREVAEELATKQPGQTGPGFPLAVLPAVQKQRPDIIDHLKSTDPGYGDHVYQTVAAWIPRALRGGP